MTGGPIWYAISSKFAAEELDYDLSHSLLTGENEEFAPQCHAETESYVAERHCRRA